MKSKNECSTTKISQAKMNSSIINTQLKSSNLRKPQHKAKEVCQKHSMKRGSHFTKQKEYSRKKGTTKTCPPKTAGKHKEHHPKTSVGSSPIEKSMVQKSSTTTDVPYHQSIKEWSTFLSTYNDQSVSFICEDEDCEIYIEDVKKKQKKGDGVDGQMVMVSLSPTKGKDLWVYAIKEELSVKLQKCEKPSPDKAFFLLHKMSSQNVQFECRSNPGVFIGVKDNHLALIKVEDQTEILSRENIIFKLSKT